MRTRSNEIYLKLLAALHEQDVRYVVLRDNPTLDAPIRDLDMLVDPAQKDQFAACARENGFVLIKDGYTNPGKKVWLHHSGDISLLLDVHEMMVYRGLEFMDTKSILKNRVQKEGYYAPGKEDFTLALLFHNILAKKEIQAKHRELLQHELGNGLDTRYLENSTRAFGLLEVYKQVTSKFEDACDNPKIVRKLSKKAKKRLKKRPANFFRLLQVRLRFLSTYFFGPKRAQVIAFIGPDGAGKSTTIKAIRQKLKETGLNVHEAYMGPWGGSILKLRKLFFLFNPNPYRSDYKEYYAGKRKEKPGALTGLSKWKLNFRSFFYYFILVVEMWTRWWFRVLPALRQGRVVLADRYIYDILTGYKNRPMDYQIEIREKICKKYPQPEIGILLDSEPEIIFSRKPQLTPVQLAHSREMYHRIAKEYGFDPLDTSVSVENTLAQFEEVIMPKLLR
ncbi:MAG: hypothetical protein H6696_19545 [Deferribacteres bacterium]|nr:hypothetical protein [candidate division KSB1 bacterium]MCB9504123.1 hypothetical protein [Deferribacteres bacterium]